MKEKYTSFRDIPQFTSWGSYAVDYPLDHLIRYVDDCVAEQGLQLCPDFQRGHVWSRSQQVAYVEFLLRGGKSGRDLFFNCPSWHHQVGPGEYDDFVCVDGLQRITAVRAFVENRIPAFGTLFRDYTDTLRIMNDTLRVHINTLKTRREVLTWYLEINSGGTPHTKKELTRVKALLDAAGQE